MTIRKGEPWGRAGALDPHVPRVDSDHDAAVYLDAHRGHVVALTGGSLHEMLGGRVGHDRLSTDQAMTFPVDLGWVLVGGRRHPFIAAAVARSRFGHRGVAVLNVQSVGPYRLGHRAHPNDARLDVTWWDLPTRQLIVAARRARLGAHTPHPGIRESKLSGGGEPTELDFGRSLAVRIDGRPVGRARRIVVAVEPDAGYVAV